MASNDFGAVLHMAHRMKGVGEPYGFPAISLLGIDIDQAAQKPDKARLVQLLAQYAHYLDNVRVSTEV